MRTIQSLHRKQSGRQYIHYVISFDTDVSFDTAFDVACECASFFAGDFQYILALHMNTDNPHTHIVLNSVNVHTDKKFSQSKSDLIKFREFVNTCLEKYGLNPVGESSESTDFVCYSSDDIYDSFDDYDFFEEDLEEDTEPSGFFGPLDAEECEQIAQAESYDAWQSQIIAYFTGEASQLPLGINPIDAESLYLQWESAQHNYDEEEINEFFQ